jgi:hypothetical protein
MQTIFLIRTDYGKHKEIKDSSLNRLILLHELENFFVLPLQKLFLDE